MRIMKYQAGTEKEAMLLVKEELGSDALILEIKSVKPKGIFRWFRKPFVEVTAALDENNKDKKKTDWEAEEFKAFLSGLSQKQREIEKQAQKQEPKISEVAEEKEKSIPETVKQEKEQEEPSSEQNIIRQVIYEQLLENEVEEPLANKLLRELSGNQEELSFEEGLNLVYRQIVEELSDVKPIEVEKGKAKPIFFIGSTGVGKTTTIAKLASIYTLVKKYKVALITADTYRIAAVEQLRTYANILDIPIKVIYKEEEIIDCIEEFSDMDLILIDTAGRSYQDTKHLNELKELLAQVEEKQVYLVLSLSTKNSDLKKTISAYHFTDLSLIFTKLDETLAYGSILNLKHQTGKSLAYVTTGQNVPEDIAELDPYEIANKILGGVNA
ncbi:MAG: flagellar biosynthesis protein FlhF [Eubacteriales bacterium]|nr:flagellar biosynthesis protein FlhF [Eubacteriales bacterium]